eukprot:10649.XXX_547039_547398_1 [CDS] Oithona nana genome sequencing.
MKKHFVAEVKEQKIIYFIHWSPFWTNQPNLVPDLQVMLVLPFLATRNRCPHQGSSFLLLRPLQLRVLQKDTHCLLQLHSFYENDPPTYHQIDRLHLPSNQCLHSLSSCYRQVPCLCHSS